ncbi:MAG TPA: acyl-CoA dehydrogenase family protein [Candidatus Limnocylindrales bacterium]
MTSTPAATEASPDGRAQDDRAEIASRLATALTALRGLELGDEFDRRAAEAIVAAKLHTVVVPRANGGLGADIVDAAEMLAAIGATDGSTALGFAMHVHVVGSIADSPGWPEPLRDWLYREVVEGGALVNAASTEEAGGSPARGAVPGTVAQPTPNGYRLSGEKTWTTWLPALRYALVSARVGGAETSGDPPRVGTFLVDLEAAGVSRLPGFDALGMRGSASGRLRLEGVEVGRDKVLGIRAVGSPDPRGPAPQAWFGIAVAAVYLGVGEGARSEVARWAIARRPGDGSTAVADIPTVQLRLGRIDAALRAARIVVLEVARRWRLADASARASLSPDLALAKLQATSAAVLATDEALRIAGGPGFLAGRIERAFRDARAGLINPPLEDVALQGFARTVLDRERGD